jgi:catechol-2,3-dioxygenase
MASPIKLAHVVLKTARFAEMVPWWKKFLGATARHENDFISFLSYDEEHHRLAIVNLPHLTERPRDSVGVEHFAFTYASIDDLFDNFERLKAEGILPYWTINHGMTLSAYYRDPDGNQVETQVDALSMEEADAFISGPLFAENPIGIDVDMDALVARWRNGESAASILAYVPVT